MQVNITNGTLTQLQETLSPNQYYALPSSVLVSGASSLYVGGTITLTDITASVSITANGKLLTYPSFRDIKITDNTDYITFNLDGVDFDLLLEPEIVVDPILANNEWSVIKSVCQSGQAGNYWALGDGKTIAVDGVGNVEHQIVDMTTNRYQYTSNSSTYSKVVFQAKDVILLQAFNSSSNLSPNNDTAYNGWGYSDLRTALQPSGTIYAKYPSAFTSLLESVKTMAAYSGKTNTLVYSDDKLFIPAAREVKANYTSVQSCEVSSEQTQYGFYAQNSDANANRIKNTFGTSTPTYWWLRSPVADNAYSVRYVGDDGSMNRNIAYNSYGVVPCFAW